MNAARHLPLTPFTPSAAPGRWPPVLAAALVWGLLALVAGYWGLRWWGEAPQQALPVPPVPALSIDSTRVASALGARVPSSHSVAAPVAPALGSRFKLLGVVAAGRDRGAALISVDGQPARPYRVGAVLTDEVRVLSLGPRHAEVGETGVAVRLEMPAQSAAQTAAARSVLPGLLPVPGAAAAAPAPAAPTPAATASPSRFVRP